MERAAAGEEFLVERRGRPYVRLSAVVARPPRHVAVGRFATAA